MSNVAKSLSGGMKKIPGVLQLIANVVTILGVIAILLNIGDFVGLYNRTMENDTYWQQTLKQLNVEATISVFSQKLGQPTIVNNDGLGLKTSIYINPKFYVTATHDSVGKVLIYSITTRTSDFNPSFGSMYDNHIILGVTKFGDLSGNPSASGVEVGTHDFYYEDMYYYGNPGNYLTYVYSVSNAGYSQGDYKVLDKLKNGRDLNQLLNNNCKDKSSPYYSFPTLGSTYSHAKDKIWQTFRDQTTINTVTVIAPNPIFLCENLNANPYKEVPQFGVNYNQVRLFD